MNKKDMVESKLRLKELLFDNLIFERIGSKNDNILEPKLSVQIGRNNEEDLYKTVLNMKVIKKDEYEIEICIHGLFSFEGNNLSENMKENLIKKNTVAIMMPYVRSQLTLLSSQPGMEPIVLPPFNINAMLDEG